MVEVPVHVAVVGIQCKCPKCWAVLEVIADHPLRLAVSTHPQRNIVRASSPAKSLDHSESDE
jgi:hypothetical protein